MTNTKISGHSLLNNMNLFYSWQFNRFSELKYPLIINIFNEKKCKTIFDYSCVLQWIVVRSNIDYNKIIICVYLIFLCIYYTIYTVYLIKYNKIIWYSNMSIILEVEKFLDTCKRWLLLSKALQVLIPFSASYFCKKAFSGLVHNGNKYSN